MPIEWAGLGPELLVRLDRRHREPLRTQLERALRDAIRSGRLTPGERLPSSRSLARDLGISRNLVLDCYLQLRAEGYLSTHSGSATRVAVPAGTEGPAEPGRAGRPAPPAPQKLAVDFRPGTPDLRSFPMSDWLWALRAAARVAPTSMLGYDDGRGSEELRGVLAAYLRRVRGAVADPERMVICTGYTQALNLILRALAATGIRRVAVEDPSDSDLRAIPARAGMEVVNVPVDGQGIDVEALAATGVRAVVLTPAHQSPTGVVLAPQRRQALAGWATDNSATIVEDDYDAEFRYDREPVGALQGLAPDRVANVGSASKSLAPGIRLGWIACPADLVDVVAAEKRVADRGSPVLDQLALASLIESGRYDRHLRRMRTVYGARREVLVAALARHAPQVALHGLAAGFHAVADLPEPAREQTVIEQARARSIGLYGMSDYRSTGRSEPPQLVVGFGNLTESAIERGIATVGDLLRG